MAQVHYLVTLDLRDENEPFPISAQEIADDIAEAYGIFDAPKAFTGVTVQQVRVNRLGEMGRLLGDDVGVA